MFKKLQMYLCVLGGTLLINLALSAVHASTDTHWVESVLIVPSDGSTDNIQEKTQHILNASRLVQQQWASWGRTFNLHQTVRVIRSDRPLSDFQNSSGPWAEQTRGRMIQELRDAGIFHENAKYNIFMEGANGGAAAHGAGCCATYYGGVTESLFEQLPTYFSFYNPPRERHRQLVSVGVIGHELGHVFRQPHENCNGTEDAAQTLRDEGLPDHQTISLMCNGFWPNVQRPEQWRLDRMIEGNLYQWFAETSGGSSHDQAGALHMYPVHDSTTPKNYMNLRANNSELCVHVGWADEQEGAAFHQGRCVEGEPHRQLGVVFAPGGMMLKARHSDLCLTVENSSRRNGAQIVQQQCTEADNQIVNWGQGDKIIFKHSNKCLLVKGRSNNVGVELIQGSCKGQALHKQFTKNTVE